MGSNTNSGIVATPENVYRNLIGVTKGISSFKLSEFGKAENKSPELKIEAKSRKCIDKTTSEEKGVNAESQKPAEQQNTVVPKGKKEQVVSADRSKLPARTEEPKKEIVHTKESKCRAQERMGWFPFKPFADTARAVGIPALSSYKAASDSYASSGGILDSTALLGLYYFDYDRLVINKPELSGKEGAWISMSLLTLIYRSEQDDPLSFLMLGYGITSTHWERFLPDEYLETQEIVLEEQEREEENNYGDIIFKN